jgi:hypothetical protein
MGVEPITSAYTWHVCLQVDAKFVAVSRGKSAIFLFREPPHNEVEGGPLSRTYACISSQLQPVRLFLKSSSLLNNVTSARTHLCERTQSG